MTVTNQQGFPQINTPFLGASGTLTQPWYRLLMTLWNRTGGAVSTSSVAGTYPGEIRAFGSSSAVPSGWLVCDGAAVSRSTYASLFSAIGVTWGAGDSLFTFNVPNFQFKTLVGADSTRLPGASGGSSTTTLSIPNLPAHSHTIVDPGHDHAVTDPGHDHAVTDPGHAHTALVGSSTNTAGGAAGTSTAGNTGSNTTGLTVDSNTTGLTVDSNTTGITAGSTGSGTSFSNMPPYGIVVWAIKT